MKEAQELSEATEQYYAQPLDVRYSIPYFILVYYACTVCRIEYGLIDK
jgi:hypothetical protein